MKTLFHPALKKNKSNLEGEMKICSTEDLVKIKCICKAQKGVH